MKSLKKILLGVGIVAFLGFLTMLLIPASAWDGGKLIRVRVHVNPRIQNVKIRLVPYHHLDLAEESGNVLYPPVIPDENGTAELRIMCRAGGGKGLFFKTGRLHVEEELTIEAPGYRPVRAPLANFIRGEEWSFRKEHFDFKVWLIKAKEVETPNL